MAADGSVVIEIKGDADEILKSFRKISGAADSLEDDIQGAFEGGKKSMKEYSADVMRLANEYKRAGMGASEAMKRAHAEIDRSLYDTAKKAKDSSREVSGSWDDAAAKISAVFKGSFLADLAMKAVSMVTDALVDLGKEALSAADSLTKFESTMSFAGFDAKDIETSKQAVQDYAARTVYDLETVANTTAQLAANGIKDYVGLTEAAGNLNAVAGGNADTFQSVAMMLTQTAGAGKLTTENWNQLADAIPGASGKLQEAMLQNGAYTGDFRDAMAEGQITAEEFNEAIMQLGLSDAAIEAASSVSTIEGAVGNLKATIVDGMTGLLTDGGMEAITGFINGIADTLQSAGQYIAPAIETIKSAVSGVGDAFKNAFTGSQQSAILGFFQRLGPALVGLPFQAVAVVVQALSGALQALVTIGGAVVNFFAGLPGTVNSVGAGFSALASTISGALSGALQSAIAWGSNMVSSARSAMQNVVTNIGSTLRGAISQVTTIGRQIVQGLANGIRNAASQVVSALGSVVQNAINAAKAKLGIASPSKVFKQFGEWTSEGYAIGVENGTKYAINAISDLSDAMTREATRLNDEMAALEKAAAEKRQKTQEEIQKEALQSQIDALEEQRDALEKFTDEYQDALEDVQKTTDSLSGKLSDFELFNNDEGDMHLWNLQPMIDSINAYGDAIMALKERGIGESLLNEILGMDRSEATAFANELLGMADEQYDGYMDLWKQKEDAAQRVAESIYATEVDAIHAEYSEKLPDVLGDAATDAMGTFSENLAAAGEGAIDAAAAIADGVIAEIERINAAQRLQAAVQSAASSFGGKLGASATNAAEASTAARRTQASEAATMAAMSSIGNASREIVLNINGKEAARALVDDIRSVEDQSPRIVSD